MTNFKSVEKLEIINILRGLSALAVAWFHYTNGNPEFLSDGWLKLSGKYGWLGVEVFFVLSGFIIPYSLWRNNFKLKFHWQTFLIKRFIRIYPAYIISILLIILFWYISTLTSANFQGVEINLYNTFLHLALLNGIFNQPWLNSAFWTLGIEFQYYILIALIYPLLDSYKTITKICLILVLCIFPFVFKQDSLIFSWLLLFNFGTLAFQLITKQITSSQYWLLTILVTFLSYLNKEFIVAIAGFFTSIIIVYIQSPPIIFFSFLGEISYSLYLLHSPIGGKITYLCSLIGDRFNTESIKFLSLLCAMTVSIFMAYLMYKYVEKASQNYIKNIKYYN